jgi:extracellular factor (EF) 3-hydroxypalmitic acid methyl ester biosynthesis protein
MLFASVSLGMQDNNSSDNTSEIGGLVLWRNNHGGEFQGTLASLERHRMVFEVYGSATVLRTSEVLEEVKIYIGDDLIYSGRAVVCTLVHTGTVVLCEASLEDGWLDVDLISLSTGGKDLRPAFDRFIRQWQKLYQITAEYKLVIADMQSLLFGLRTWLDQVELGIRALPAADRLAIEQQTAEQLKESVASALQPLFERFEKACAAIDPASHAAHRSFCRKQLHPFLMCSPFMHRIYHKPLGYAGDYEMMNMIWRNGYEGSSLFAKLLNAFILSQAPARSVRNRVEHLTGRIGDVALDVDRARRTARVFSVGCGPAREVENFMAHPLADRCEFSLLDFNEETLSYVNQRMTEARTTYRRSTPVHTIKKSVQQLFKETGKPRAESSGFDLIYSSGLYDYLTDRICKQLNSYLYDRLAPGGVLIVTNFDPSNPIRNWMEYAFEWFLLHRAGKDMAALVPDQARPEYCKVHADSTGCNVFLEVTKPAGV